MCEKWLLGSSVVNFASVCSGDSKSMRIEFSTPQNDVPTANVEITYATIRFGQNQRVEEVLRRILD
jgi:hypothetical protein